MNPSLFVFRSFVLCFFVLNTLNLFGQIDAPVQLDVFPPTPTAASLGKFAEIPMGYYTGTPNINIPIYEAKEGNIKVPVSLSYHSGGIQVQEIASWVGLGFALNAGGVISRTVRGFADDITNGWLDQSILFPTSYPSDNSQYNSFAAFAKDINDSQPDLFTFNFGGRTGKFQLDKQGNIYIVPFQKIKIVCLRSAFITGWKITTEDGFIYTFDVPETGKTYSQCTNGQMTKDRSEYTSSWYLSSITSPSGATMTFQYETGYVLNYPIGIFEHNFKLLAMEYGYSSASRSNLTCTSYQNSTSCARLKKIMFTSGSIEFIAGMSRADLLGDKMLDQIVVKNDRGIATRRFYFRYNYMNGGGMLGLQYADTSMTSPSSTMYRLALVSFQETDGNGNALKPPYEFNYDVGLPDRLSFSADYWGFYNGVSTNSTLVPATATNGSAYNGASRVCDINYATKGTLTKIVYPTGGTTSFTFELHKADQGIKDMVAKSVTFRPDIRTYTDPNSNITYYYIVNKNYSVPFTVKSIGEGGTGGFIDISSFPCLSGGNTNTCDLYVNIYKVNSDQSLGPLVFSTSGAPALANPNIQAVWLDNGNYTIYCPQQSGNYYPFAIKVSWNELTGNPECTVGGLRVSRMENYDPITNKKVVKNYKYIDNSTLQTSGKALSMPVFDYEIVDWGATPVGGNYPRARYYVRTSTSNMPPGMTQGSFVGYAEVTEYVGENVTSGGTETGYGGQTIYKYSHPGICPDQYVVAAFPFPPSESRDWMRGDLIEQTDYSKQGQNYVPVRKLINQYKYYNEFSNMNSNVRNCQGLKVGIMENMINFASITPVTYTYFNFNTGYKELVQSKEILYDPSDISKFVTKVTNYSYSPNHLQLTSSERIQSDGKKLVQYISYPPDYTDNTGFIQDLNAANIINVPIEKITCKTESDGSNVRILSGEIDTYKSGGRGLMDVSNFLETNTPIPLANFRFSNRSSAGIIPTTGTNSAFYLDPSVYVKRITYDAYDNKGNVLQYTKDGFVSSLIWGYNNNLPVAKIDNAARGNDIALSSQVAYNGFEMGATSIEYGWQNVSTTNMVDKTIDPDNVFAGRNAYKMLPGTSSAAYTGPTFYLTPPSPQNGKYKMSCRIKTATGYAANKASLIMYTFAKGSCCTATPVNSFNNQSLAIPATNNTWQYFEVVLDFNTLRKAVSTDLSIACYAINGDLTYSVYIDEIRIAPVDAQVTTYTYDPQIGPTSETLPSGTATFYEYDTLGRLKNVRNQDGNILNSTSYIYRNQ